MWYASVIFTNFDSIGSGIALFNTKLLSEQMMTCLLSKISVKHKQIFRDDDFECEASKMETSIKVSYKCSKYYSGHVEM